MSSFGAVRQYHGDSGTLSGALELAGIDNARAWSSINSLIERPGRRLDLMRKTGDFQWAPFRSTTAPTVRKYL